jgi:hypothetical protein
MSAYRVLRNAVGVVALGLFAGCATNDVSQVGERPREAITFAAQSSYPSNPKYVDQYKAVALYDATRKEIDIYNLGKDPVPATAVWVNGRFVSRVSTISPRSHISVPYKELIESGAGVNDFAQMATVPIQVELQTRDGLVAAQGPVPR